MSIKVSSDSDQGSSMPTSLLLESSQGCIGAIYAVLRQESSSGNREAKLRGLQGHLLALYSAALSTPVSDYEEYQYEESEREYIVTEEQYNAVQDSIAELMGEYDTIIDGSIDVAQPEYESKAFTVSELVADVFQEIVDFVWNYRIDVQTDEIKGMLIYDYLQGFTHTWGKKVLIIARAIHDAIEMEMEGDGEYE
ncbi:DUF5063 domain-containing protein [Porphyromonas canoris]|uniref:DUF5063 domain-containing protein n=1 Tax=Porphyromonas canoris TaxID=36875 RepID=UPI0009E226E8|nr:DUF5063 domain-containing protein [Porphyromonas canoris]